MKERNRKEKTHKRLVSYLCGVAITGFLLLGLQVPVSAQVVCHNITAQEGDVGNFALPYQPYSEAKTLLLSALCSDTRAALTVGTGSNLEYIYEQAYEFRNNAWQPIALQGTRVQNSFWIGGTATAELSRSRDAMQEKNYFVAYVCTWFEGAWKCGCKDVACTAPQWQLQSFTHVPAPEEDDILGDQSDYAGEFYMGTISRYEAGHGDEVRVRGGGFSENANRVQLSSVIHGTRELTGIAQDAGGVSITFTVPSDLAHGVYKVVAGNGSEMSDFGEPLVITPTGAVRPTIIRVSPESGYYGSEVVIHGENFTPQGNVVFTTHRVYPNQPSPDGRTIRLRIEPYPNEPLLTPGAPQPGVDGSLEERLYIMNANGLSVSPARFTITL